MNGVGGIVVTVPKSFRYDGAPGKIGLAAWIAEGDAAGDPESGQLWNFSTFGQRPNIRPGDRVYIVCEGRIRGYAPLVEMRFRAASFGNGYIDLIRGGGAVAVTIPEPVAGFRGWRYRWWDTAIEVPFTTWRHGEQKPTAKAALRQKSLIGDAQ